MNFEIKGSTYIVIDVIETNIGFNIFYIKNSESGFYWITYHVPHDELRYMTYEEILLFGIHNKHSDEMKVVGDRFDNFLLYFDINLFSKLRTLSRKFIIQDILDNI